MAMLTPNKIRGYQFQQTGKGTYKAEEVDGFLSQIVESYDQVFKENGELVKKLSILATKLDEYRSEEASLRKALVNAQIFIDKMVEDAEKESKKIVAEAQERADNVDSITNAKIKVMVDEVEGKMRVAYDKAMSQAKQTKENAQKESELLLLEAREKAGKIVAEAEAKANAVISKATEEAETKEKQLKADIEKEKAILDNLKETSNKFKTELVLLYERQLKNVEQLPDYCLDKTLEENVKKIVEEHNDEIAAQPESEDVFETPSEDLFAEEQKKEIQEENNGFFDADDLIKEYSVKDYIPDEEENSEEVKDEYEDIFSDSGITMASTSDFVEVTGEEFDKILAEKVDEPYALEDEDFDFFSEDFEPEERPAVEEQPRKFDIAFSDADAVEIEKDDNLFLQQEEEKTESGFKFFDDIDLSEDEDFKFEINDVDLDADNVFEKSDDDDTEGFSFLKDVFGQND